MKAKTKKAGAPEKTRRDEPSVDAEAVAQLEEKTSHEEPRLTRLKQLVMFHDEYQALRIRFSNRLKKKKNGDAQVILHGELPPDVQELQEAYLKNAWDFEKIAAKEIKDIVSDFPIWHKYLVNVKGIGEILAAALISTIDIRTAKTVAALWCFCGLAPGKDKMVKGEKNHFSKWLRCIVCGRIGSSFLKANSPYRAHYDKRKADTEAREWGKSKMHRHKDATRIMMKAFLKDLWVAWREIEGLSVSEPWRAEMTKETNIRERVA